MSGDEFVPERDLWKRSGPIAVGIPHQLKDYYFEIKSRYGIDIANLVLFAYHEWGLDAARSFARKLLAIDSFDNLIKFLEKRAKRFGDGRDTVSTLIYMYTYSKYFNDVLEKAERSKCPGAREKAVQYYHSLARNGLFFPPDCIVLVAEMDSGCRNSVPKRCIRTSEAIRKLGGAQA